MSVARRRALLKREEAVAVLVYKLQYKGHVVRSEYPVMRFLISLTVIIWPLLVLNAARRSVHR